MYQNVKQKMNQLPPEFQGVDLSILRAEFLEVKKHLWYTITRTRPERKHALM